MDDDDYMSAMDQGEEEEMYGNEEEEDFDDDQMQKQEGQFDDDDDDSQDDDDDDDEDMVKPQMEDQRRRRGKVKRRKPTEHDHEPQFKQEDDDMEERVAKMKEMAIDIRRLDLTKDQHELVKSICSDLIVNFEMPECTNILERMREIIRLMMRTKDHRVQFDVIARDGELMEHLNNCKEDLYKQLFFNYRELFQTNLNRRWTKGMIKQISQQIIEDREQYSKVQVKKGKVPREYLWYHATILLASKLVKESDETWLESSLRAKLKVHHIKLHALIMQLESIEFAELFKKAFE